MTSLVLGSMLSRPLHVQTWKRPTGNRDYRVTNPFDGVDLVNRNPATGKFDLRHNAVDVGNFGTGDAVRAPADCKGRGLSHFDGARGDEAVIGDVTIRIWHLSKTLPVSIVSGRSTAGQWVPLYRGQVIGATGASGLGTGAHTDIRFFRNGKPFDPAPFLPMVEKPAIPLPLEDDVEIPADLIRTPNRVGTIIGKSRPGIRVRRGPVDGAVIRTLAADYPFMAIGYVDRPDGRWYLAFYSPEGADKPQEFGWVRSDLTSELAPDEAPDTTRLVNRMKRARTALEGAVNANASEADALRQALAALT